ncbi:MAG: Crp/Fnr family transcriptional regulator [Anaerolineae bacterium]|nr:Crp/Fnr family transcriptional regulator [Anaerolineae bacterium]
MPCLEPLTHTWIVRTPLFLRARAETQRALDSALHVRTYVNKQPIFLEGHRPTGLGIVVIGSVRLYHILRDGRVHVHHYVRPYETINLIPALDGRPNPVSAEAVGEAHIGWLARERLLELMTDDPELMQSCIRLLTLQNRELMARLDDIGFRTVPSRLARLLLRRGGFEREVNLPLDTLSQDEIAAVLGTSREVLGRALRQLYDLGLVRREGRQYVIVDREGLEKLAEE